MSTSLVFIGIHYHTCSMFTVVYMPNKCQLNSNSMPALAGRFSRSHTACNKNHPIHIIYISKIV